MLDVNFIRENADGFTEIVEIDPTRFNGLVKTYEGLGYSLIYVPFMSVKKRARFILEKI